MPWPYYDTESDTQYFPFKTMTMILVLLMLYLASLVARLIGAENFGRSKNYLEEINMDEDGNFKN